MGTKVHTDENILSEISKSTLPGGSQDVVNVLSDITNNTLPEGATAETVHARVVNEARPFIAKKSMRSEQEKEAEKKLKQNNLKNVRNVQKLC